MTCAPIMRITAAPLARAARIRSAMIGQVGMLERIARRIQRKHLVERYVMHALAERPDCKRLRSNCG